MVLLEEKSGKHQLLKDPKKDMKVVNQHTDQHFHAQRHAASMAEILIMLPVVDMLGKQMKYNDGETFADTLPSTSGLMRIMGLLPTKAKHF